jgi:bifunctional DNase/RNase
MEPALPGPAGHRAWEHRLLFFLVGAFAIATGATLAAGARATRPTRISKTTTDEPPGIAGLVPVKVVDVLLPDGTNNGVVLLADADSQHVLPIFLTATEGAVVRDGLHADEPPGSPDLLGRAVLALGGTVERVEVEQGANEPVKTLLVIRRQGRDVPIEAHPADALALAVVTHAPVYTTRTLLNGEGIRREAIDRLPGGLPSRLRDPEGL